MKKSRTWTIWTLSEEDIEDVASGMGLDLNKLTDEIKEDIADRFKEAFNETSDWRNLMMDCIKEEWPEQQLKLEEAIKK